MLREKGKNQDAGRGGNRVMSRGKNGNPGVRDRVLRVYGVQRRERSKGVGSGQVVVMLVVRKCYICFLF